MTIPHIHIMLNHIPVIGVLFSGILLMTAILLKNVQFQRVALLFIVFMALSVVPVFLTGEPTEEIIEDLPGVSKDFIEEHEDAAEAAFIGMEITGLLALTGLVYFRKAPNLPRYVPTGIVVLMISCMVLFTRTAYLGGHIRHSEIRADFQSTHAE